MSACWIYTGSHVAFKRTGHDGKSLYSVSFQNVNTQCLVHLIPFTDTPFTQRGKVVPRWEWCGVVVCLKWAWMYRDVNEGPGCRLILHA